jgi:hypothetical protein
MLKPTLSSSKALPLKQSCEFEVWDTAKKLLCSCGKPGEVQLELDDNEIHSFCKEHVVDVLMRYPNLSIDDAIEV